MRTVHIAPVAQVRLARVIPSMHVHLCVALWLFSPRPSLFSTSSHRSPSSPSRCSPQCSRRGPGPTPCATSAWGPWPPPTTRHPSQELWDLIVSVFGNVSRVSDRSGQPDNDVHKRHKSQKKIDVMEDIDSVPSNVQSARQEALLYVNEDNEEVIKMIIKGRSPTMRHVSRTHRVALDWLFDRINLDSKIQIKYIDTKNQFADI